MGDNRKDFERALRESTAIANRIREAIADAPPKLVMLALFDLLQEYLTRWSRWICSCRDHAAGTTVRYGVGQFRGGA